LGWFGQFAFLSQTNLTRPIRKFASLIGVKASDFIHVMAQVIREGFGLTEASGFTGIIQKTIDDGNIGGFGDVIKT
jgi:hypothetical protein